MAPLSPSPGPHDTCAPCASAHSATRSSSQATNTGSGAAAASTRSAIQRANRSRSSGASHPASRRLAAWNDLTGTSTAASTAPNTRTCAPTCVAGSLVFGATRDAYHSGRDAFVADQSGGERGGGLGGGGGGGGPRHPPPRGVG